MTTFCVYVHMGLGNVLGDWKIFGVVCEKSDGLD